jgi:nucleotide-binding universal stress UspA family protein
MRHSLLLVGPHARPTDELRDILVCLDGSEVAEAAARTAGVWASLLDLRVHLVRVAPPSTAADPHGGTADLQAVAHRLRTGLGVHASWDVLHCDRPAAALVEHARRLPASLIAMTTHGRTGALDRLIGSTAMRVVHDAPCPVLVVPR